MDISKTLEAVAEANYQIRVAMDNMETILGNDSTCSGILWEIQRQLNQMKNISNTIDENCRWIMERGHRGG